MLICSPNISEHNRHTPNILNCFKEHPNTAPPAMMYKIVSNRFHKNLRSKKLSVGL